uniref:Uncharacterized protein n=1 Tax=Parascaris univalens TaxID=6257 RepID=A0A915AST7_PARUN
MQRVNGTFKKVNADFANCVQRCGERTAGVILLKGQTSWTNICNAFRRNVGEFTTVILPCWARHGAEVGKRCSVHATIVQNAVLDLVDNGIRTIEQHFSDLCKSITMYDKCYVWQADAFCGEKAWRFVLQLNLNSSVYVHEMITIDVVDDRMDIARSPFLVLRMHEDGTVPQSTVHGIEPAELNASTVIGNVDGATKKLDEMDLANKSYMAGHHTHIRRCCAVLAPSREPFTIAIVRSPL